MSLSTLKRASELPMRGKPTRRLAPRSLVALLCAVAGLILGPPDDGSAGSITKSNAKSTSNSEQAHPISWQVDVASPPAGSHSPKAPRLYLLGSIHVGPPGGWKLSADTLARFDASDALVVEVDMREGSPEMQDDAVMRYGLLPGGESLKNHISPELYKELERYVTSIGQSMINLNPWKPWMVATMLLGFETARLGYPSETGLDLDLIARARNTQRVIGLETMAEQLALLGDMAPDKQELMLKDMLLQSKDIESYFNKLKEAWRTGDEAELQAILFRELETTPELAPFYERIIFGRNLTMCDRLQKLMQGSQETFFGVVGAYHLVGPRGIPACLSSRGFRITRLSDS